MRPSKVALFILPLAGLLAVPVLAHEHGHHGRGVCRQDLKTLCPNAANFRDCMSGLCPDVTPGPGSFATCLQQHAAQLSPACQQHLTEMQAKFGAWQQACETDVQTFCGDAGPSPRKIHRCLRQHKSQLSQACQDMLAQHRGHGHHHGQGRSTPTPGA